MEENTPLHLEATAGAGEGVPHIIDRLKQLKMKVPDDGFRVKIQAG